MTWITRQIFDSGNNPSPRVVSLPMLSTRFTRQYMATAALGLALLASACGGGSSTESGAPGSTDESASSGANESIADRAAANQRDLDDADDVRDIEVLAVDDGSISTLRAAVAGDRPVLLWFWAPH